MLVPADSIVHSWVGRLDENTLRSTDEPERLGTMPQMSVVLEMPGEEPETIIDATSLAVDPADCTERCLRWFEVIARPESRIVTFEFQDSEVCIKFFLHRFVLRDDTITVVVIAGDDRFGAYPPGLPFHSFESDVGLYDLRSIHVAILVSMVHPTSGSKACWRLPPRS